jgi:hypothetical protein
LNAKTFGRVFGRVAMMGGASLAAGCGYSVTATNGTTFPQGAGGSETVSTALMASATHDLPCASESLEVARLEDEREYSVTGCGSRVLYRVVTPSLTSRRVELVSRSAFSWRVPASPPQVRGPMLTGG